MIEALLVRINECLLLFIRSFSFSAQPTEFFELYMRQKCSVGRGIVDKALRANPPFDIYFGIDGWMLSMLTSGLTPVTSELDAICQVALMGLLRFISLFYLMDFGRITQGCYAGSATARSPQKEHRDSCCKDD